MPTAQQSSVTGPLWLSKGERFRPTGAYVFLETRHDEYCASLRKLKKQYNEVKTVIRRRRQRAMIGDEDTEESSNKETDDEEKPVEIKDKSLLSMTKKELRDLKEVGDLLMIKTRSPCLLVAWKPNERDQRLHRFL